MAEKISKTGKLRGKVVVIDGKYFFEAKSGGRYFIKQNDMAKRLAYSKELCIFEINKNAKISSDIMGEIVDIIGKEGEVLPEIEALVIERGLNRPFTSGALREANELPETVEHSEWKDYLDLRDKKFVSIDPDTAGDFDDIVCTEKNKDGSYDVYIGIAGVSHYVNKGSRLFNEARMNVASKYMGNTVYPMLPEKLSNGLCSLNEGEDRIAVVTYAKVEPSGKIKSYGIAPAVVNSKHRLTYKEADYIVYGKCDTVKDQSKFSGLVAKTIDVKSSLDAFREVSEILYKDRMKRGAIDIDSKTAQFVLDSTGTRVEAIEQEQAEKHTKEIESAMILNNIIFGEIGQKLDLPMLYRNHTLPSKEDADKLSNRMANLGVGISPNASAEDYTRLFRFLKGKPYEELGNSLVLQSFKKAYHSPENEGQFGLGVKPIDSDKEYISRKYSQKTPNEMEDEARISFYEQTGSMAGLKFNDELSFGAYAYASSPIRDLAGLINQMQVLNYIMTDKVTFSEAELRDYADICNEVGAEIDSADAEKEAILSTVWAKENLGRVLSARVVNFYPEGIALKTDMNVVITLPWSELNTKIKPALISKMVEMCGNSKNISSNSLDLAHSPIKLGEIFKVKLYSTSSKPARIFASENMSREIEIGSNGRKSKEYEGRTK